MKKKYYAVKTGKSPGIFESWEECKASVDGFPGAEYKSFSAKKDAQAYLDGEATGSQRKLESYLLAAEAITPAEDEMIAFVDGSYDVKTGRYAFGCVLLSKQNGVETDSGVGDDPQAQTARNVAGELMGTMFAVRTAYRRGLRRLKICHDYIGISKWYEKKWKAESFCAKQYIAYMEKFRPLLDIRFEKIESHTGVPLNEAADLLAKAALGI